jgi:hypothetical protein
MEGHVLAEAISAEAVLKLCSGEESIRDLASLDLE